MCFLRRCCGNTSDELCTIGWHGLSYRTLGSAWLMAQRLSDCDVFEGFHFRHYFPLAVGTSIFFYGCTLLIMPKKPDLVGYWLGSMFPLVPMVKSQASFETP